MALFGRTSFVGILVMSKPADTNISLRHGIPTLLLTPMIYRHQNPICTIGIRDAMPS